MATAETSTATFTSSVLPAKPGLKGSLSLPVGFILNPLVRPRTVAGGIQRVSSDDMNICLTCGSYLNVYSPPDVNSGNWTCCICQALNAAPPSISSSQICSSPIVEYCQVAAGVGADVRVPSNSQNANHAFDALSINEEHVEDPTMIVIDANIPPKEVNALLKHLSTLHLNNAGLMIFNNNIHVYQIGLRGIASADIYSPSLDPADSGLEADERMYWGSFEEVEYCANVYFGTSGMQTHTSTDPVNTLHALPNGHGQQQPLSRTEMLRLKREARIKKKSEKSFNGFDPNGAAEFINTLRAENKPKSQREGMRCTGEAAQYALHLMNGTKSKTGRVLIFTSGCCSVGKGSVVTEASVSVSVETNKSFARGDILDPEQARNASEFMYSLGKTAFNNGVGIDVFCGGNSALGASALLALVKPSGGYVLSHSSFEDAACYHDMSFVCRETRMSRAMTDNRDADNVGLRMASAHAMNSLNGVIVDLRMPSFITPTLYHGPGAISKEGRSPLPNERSTFARCASLAAKQGLPTHNLPSATVIQSTLTQIQIGRYDPYSNISIMMQVDRKVPDQCSHVHFQFVTRYIDPVDNTKFITRVATQIVVVSADDSKYLDSLNEKVITILLAKEAAFRSMISKTDDEDDRFNVVLDAPGIDACAFEAQRDLDATIYMISASYDLDATIYSSSHSKSGALESIASTASVPPLLSSSLRKLHHFRRGSIVGTNHQSLDDRLLIRQIFLRSPLHECTQMTMPTAWRCFASMNGSIEFAPVPAETLSLWDESVLAVDTFDYLFVWSGKATLHQKHDPLRKACISFLLDRSKLRFPSPKLHVLIEGDPMSRKLTTRLVPSHGDPHEEQIARFPDLRMLNPNSIDSLRAKFRLYDPGCDSTFRDWSGKVSEFDNGGDTLCC